MQAPVSASAWHRAKTPVPEDTKRGKRFPNQGSKGPRPLAARRSLPWGRGSGGLGPQGQRKTHEIARNRKKSCWRFVFGMTKSLLKVLVSPSKAILCPFSEISKLGVHTARGTFRDQSCSLFVFPYPKSTFLGPLLRPLRYSPDLGKNWVFC